MITPQPVPIRSPIFGPAYVGTSSNLIDDQCINLFPEIVEVGDGREVGALYGTPGLLLWNVVGSGPIRGMLEIKEQGILYVVSGSHLYSVTNANVITSLGMIGGPGGYFFAPSPGFSRINLPFDVQTTGTFVTMTNNSNQLAVFVGMSCEQQDQFGLVNDPGTFNFYQSNLGDLSTWPALQFGEASADPDVIVSIKQIRREVFIIKQLHTEVWNNVGSQGFVFAREQGPYMQAGCVAPASVAKADETIFWLAQNSQGRGVVVMLSGYQLQRVSNFYIENQIQSWPDMTDAIGFAYQQNGHTFYVLSSASGNQTWVYDFTLSTLTQKPMWHQRALYSGVPGLEPSRHPASCFASFQGLPLVGDNTSGNIYSYNTNTFTDNGTVRAWLRSWRATSQPASGRIMKFHALTMGMETGGSQVPSSLQPNIMLRWSDDGGRTFVPQIQGALGPVGQTAQRIRFNRLGALKAESGYDRVFELSGSDPVPARIIDAKLEVSP